MRWVWWETEVLNKLRIYFLFFTFHASSLIVGPENLSWIVSHGLFLNHSKFSRGEDLILLGIVLAKNLFISLRRSGRLVVKLGTWEQSSIISVKILARVDVYFIPGNNEIINGIYGNLSWNLSNGVRIFCTFSWCGRHRGWVIVCVVHHQAHGNYCQSVNRIVPSFRLTLF